MPFGRSRHRAYEDITRALVKGVDVDDLEPMTALLHAKRGSVGHEINALRSEIARVQSTLSTIKSGKAGGASASACASNRLTTIARKKWSTMERASKRRSGVQKAHNLWKSSRARDEEAQELIIQRVPEPATRGMAIMLSRRLDEVLPEGSIEGKCARLVERGGLGATNGEVLRRSSLQIDTFSDDFAILDTALREGARQVSAGCRDRGVLIDSIRERYGELFSTMRNVCDRWLRRNESLVIEMDGLKGALDTKELELIELTEYATRCRHEADSAKRQQRAGSERADLISKRSRERERELITMQTIDRAELRRLHERIKLTELQHRRDVESAVSSMEDSLHKALNDRDELAKRISFLDNQLLTTRMMLPDKSCYATSDTQTTTEDARCLALAVAAATTSDGIAVAIQTDPCAHYKRRRRGNGAPPKDSSTFPGLLHSEQNLDTWKREALGGFASLVASKKTGRRKPRAWVLKCIAHIYADKLIADAAVQGHDEFTSMRETSSTQTLANFVYDWHMHKFGLRQLAEANLLDLLASTVYHAAECGIVSQFGVLCGFESTLAQQQGHHTHQRAPTLTDAPAVTFYLRLLEGLAGDGHLSQLFIEFGMSNDRRCDGVMSSSNSLALTRATEAVKRAFEEFADDTVALKDFVASQLGVKNITGTSTIRFSTLTEKVMDEYTSRRAASTETLKALFRAADCDGDGLLTRDEFYAAIRLASARITDAAIGTIFETCSRLSRADTSQHVVDADSFIKACVANGMERFRLVLERSGAATDTSTVTSSRKKHASTTAVHSTSSSIKTIFDVVDAHIAAPDGAVARFKALAVDANVPLERCRRQLARLDALRASCIDAEATHIALKLLAHEVRAASVRAKGGFKRLGVAVLHQVSFSLRAEKTLAEGRSPSDVDRDRVRSEELDPLL